MYCLVNEHSRRIGFNLTFLARLFSSALYRGLSGSSLMRTLLIFLGPEVIKRLWWTQFFNGQVKRFEFIAACMREVKFNHVIETGTFLGSSTIALASLSGCKTHSIELDSKNLSYARERIASDYANLDIVLYEGDSQEVLPEILKNCDPQTDSVFLYLDAHWTDDLPLSSEIQALNNWGGRFLAVIDDFKIDQDEGYAFDKYGAVEVGKESIPLNEFTTLYTLAAHSSTETGARRGTGIVIHNSLKSEFSSVIDIMIREL